MARIVIVITALSMAMAAFGQRGGQNPGGSATNPPGAPTAPTPGNNPPMTNPNPRTPQPQQPQQPDMTQRPIFLSGKVMLDSGTPPPEPVVIERVCGGNPRPEAWTDSKGHFSFQLGQNTAMMADASVGNVGGLGFPDYNSGGGTNQPSGMNTGSSGMGGGSMGRDLMN